MCSLGIFCALLVTSCQEKTKSAQAMLLPDLSLHSVFKIHISSAEEELTLENLPEGWQITSPVNVRAYSPAVMSALFALVDLPRGTMVASTNDSLNELGFGSSDADTTSNSVKISLHLENEKAPRIIELGATSQAFDDHAVKALGEELTNRRYVRAGDDQEVSLVNYPFNEFSPSYLDWIDFTLPHFPQRVAKARFRHQDQEQVIKREKPFASFTRQSSTEPLPVPKQKALNNFLYNGEFYLPLTEVDQPLLSNAISSFEVEDFEGKYFLVEVGGQKTFEEEANQDQGQMGFRDEPSEGEVPCRAIRFTYFAKYDDFLTQTPKSQHEFFLRSVEVEPILTLTHFPKKP